MERGCWSGEPHHPCAARSSATRRCSGADSHDVEPFGCFEERVDGSFGTRRPRPSRPPSGTARDRRPPPRDVLGRRRVRSRRPRRAAPARRRATPDRPNARAGRRAVLQRGRSFPPRRDHRAGAWMDVVVAPYRIRSSGAASRDIGPNISSNRSRRVSMAPPPRRSGLVPRPCAASPRVGSTTGMSSADALSADYVKALPPGASAIFRQSRS